MKLLFIGQTAIWEAMVVAEAYLGNPHPSQWRLWGQVEAEKAGGPVYIGTDVRGNEVYTLGVPHPWIAANIVKDLQEICYPRGDKVETFTINVGGQAVTRLLSRIAAWPVIGGAAFLLAGYRVRKKADRLIALGEEIARFYAPVEKPMLAAKPWLGKTET